jgi:Zn-dependent peptidase ImmA (M78 family)/plasmid maintenance system antidote protein VapI
MPQADWFSKPGDTIKSLMQRREIPAVEIAAALPGGMQKLRDLLEGRASIDASTARALQSSLGGSVSFWLKRQKNYEAALDRAVSKAVQQEADQWLNEIPTPVASKANPVSKGSREDRLRHKLVYYNVANLRTWDARYGSIPSETHFRTSPSFQSNRAAVLAWLRRGEIEADLIVTKPWSSVRLKQLLPDIRALSKIGRPDRFLPRLREILSDAGVALVVVPTPRGCHASGAARLVSPDKAMVMVSFRHRSDDQFWFTMFHELGHVLLHQGHAFVDEDETPESPAEREANDFAMMCIVPPARRPELLKLGADKDSIVRFAVSVGVNPGLIVGQMQHEGIIDHGRMERLKRRWTWDEIRPAAGLA